MHALAVALWNAGILGHFERDPATVERFASDLIELSTRHQFAVWLPIGAILRGWARSASGTLSSIRNPTTAGTSRTKERVRSLDSQD
jgi:hypothetical protein